MKRRRQRKDTVWKPWPTFMAWCPEAQRFEAFTSTLIALAGEAGVCNVFDYDDDESDFFLPPVKAAEQIRPSYEKCGNQRAHINHFAATSGRMLNLCPFVTRDRNFPFPGHPSLNVGFWSEPFLEGRLLPDKLIRFKGFETPLDLQAGVAWFMAVSDMQDILKRFCSSHPAITTGCCVEGPYWGAPLTGAASYHADAYPGRDLALSWIHLHDKDPLALAVGWTIEVLRERVEASPHGSSVVIVDEERLTREQVLAALELPRKTLVEALEVTAAERHPKWAAIETELGGLLEQIRDVVANPDARYLAEMVPVPEEMIQLIEEYSPAYVEHLDNGALMLYAHPDRTLWPLWAGALTLLGIRPTITAPNRQRHERAHDPQVVPRCPPARSISEWSSDRSLVIITPNVRIYDEAESDRYVVCRRSPFPHFVVWYRDGDPIDAWSATMSALAHESGICSMCDATEEPPRTSLRVPLTEARVLLRREPEKYEWATMRFNFDAPSGRVLPTWSAFSKSRGRYEWFVFESGNWGDLFPLEIPYLKRDRPYSLALESSIVWHIALQDCYDLLLRICRSNPAITSGGCMETVGSGVALTNGATYNADGYPGRDIALSWLHRYNPYDETVNAGVSIDALHEIIEAAPPGTRVRILDPEDQLTREQVLAALALPAKDLVAALEAAAARIDPAWQAIQAENARVLDELEKASVNDVETLPLNGDHIRFIQNHSPAFVERLENGALILYAHPYRTLWPLWTRALDLLGIRPKTTT